MTSHPPEIMTPLHVGIGPVSAAGGKESSVPARQAYSHSASVGSR